ncbi:hypothetical protein GNT65_06590 [Shewanella sp. JBTF-M18]|uniref:Uncharacterized protein n=1 Tax=Shewanella insulae TaxID=2681496 RepID=A0A6L7HXD2_9GAMM|nr:hypothetical protein [Shewanella insulae]MXR68344.1 hypothetical protein [Shewanella insulae]
MKKNTNKNEGNWNFDNKNGWDSAINDNKSFISGLFIGFAIGVVLGALL